MTKTSLPHPSTSPQVTADVFDPTGLIAQRALDIDASGIRKVFDLAAKLKDPINLSIGQPDFDVPEPLKQRMIEAIQAGKNRYTPTQGIAELIAPIRRQVMESTGWRDPGILILSGTSAGIMLSMCALLNPGDEVLFLDPYFVMYRHLPKLIGAVPVAVDTYPDFRLHADRIAAAITPRTRLLILCSPSNPTGVTLTATELSAVAQIARKHKLMVLSDEIYDAFCYQKHESIAPLLPEQCIQLKGYSKTYGMTGWRLGYAAGPQVIIEQMSKLQQYTFVCAPAPAQYAALELYQSHRVDMTPIIDAYRRKRDMVVGGLAGHFAINPPGGAFYVFPQVPGRQTATEFVARAVDKNVLLIPGQVFSSRDTHFRISYAIGDEKLKQGIGILNEIAENTA